MLSFKKKLGFVSLFVLGSFILSHPALAMFPTDAQGGEDEQVDQSFMEVDEREKIEDKEAGNVDPRSKGSKKRKPSNKDEGNKKNPANNQGLPNKRQKTERGNTIPSSSATRASSPPIGSSGYSAQGPVLRQTPFIASVLASMDDTANIVIPTPMKAMAAAHSAATTAATTTATTTRAVGPQGVDVETPAAQTYLSLEQIQNYIKQAQEKDENAQTTNARLTIIGEYYKGRYQPLLSPASIYFLGWAKILGQTLQERCAHDDAWAFYVVGHYEQLKTYFPTLIESIRERAVQGHAGAQTNLGVCYQKGEGVPKDEKKAFECFTLAANQENAAAQNSLGVYYQGGIGVPKDEEKAVDYYILAANQGNAQGQMNLGGCYENGIGVPKDEKKAVKHYTLAAHQGHAAAQHNLGVCYQTGMGVPKDEKKAFDCFTLAANQGDAAAQNNLGYCYENGIGVPKDEKKAFDCFTLAANQGHAVAQYNLGYCYQKGEGVHKNMALALYWKMMSKNKKSDKFIAAHMWYLPLAPHQDDEKCAPKLTTIINNLALSEKHFQEKITEEEKQPWPLQGVMQAYQAVSQNLKEAIDLFERISTVLKQGFMVPKVGVSTEVNLGYQTQPLPRKLDLCYDDKQHYLSFGEQAIQCQKDLFQLEKKFEEADQVLEGLVENHYGLLIAQKERELDDKRMGSNPDQEECKRLAEKIGYFTKLGTTVQKDRERLAQHKQEAKSFIRSTAKDRQDIWHEEYPAVPQKR